MNSQPRLTPAQQRILDEVRRDKVRTYTGRSHQPINTLMRLGLVTVTWEYTHFGDRATVRPIGATK